jgi:hypothetical protein
MVGVHLSTFFLMFDQHPLEGLARAIDDIVQPEVVNSFDDAKPVDTRS